MDLSTNLRLGAEREEDRLVEVARDSAGGRSRDGSEAAVKALCLRFVDLQRFRVGKREPSRIVRPARGESAPLRFEGWRDGSWSPSLRKPMSYSKQARSLSTGRVQSALWTMSEFW